MKLNLGCSNQILKGWRNVDCRPLPGVDMVWNLDEMPWPWPDGSVDEIFMAHCLEHLCDPLKALNECRRVLKVGGKLTVKVPHAKGAFANSPAHSLYRFSRIWFQSFSCSPDDQVKFDALWGDQTLRMSLLHHRFVNWHGAHGVIMLFAKCWDAFWNQRMGLQVAWEMLGILPPSEITWTAVKK